MSQLNLWFTKLPPERQKILREDKWMLAEAAFKAGRDTKLENIDNNKIITLLKKKVEYLKNLNGIENIDDTMGFYFGDTLRQICDLVEFELPENDS